MALNEGLYVVRNLAATNLCLNSAGALDKNGSNVWLFTYDSSDACFVYATNVGDDTLLSFAATGRYVTNRGGTLAQGNTVVQGNHTAGATQRWRIVPTTRTASVGGTTYTAQKVYLASTYSASAPDSWLLEVNGTGTPTSGRDACIAHDEGTADDQMWLFVPVASLRPGTYRIVPKADPRLALSVAGASTAHGAGVVIDTFRDQNSQKWVIKNQTSGRQKISPAHDLLDALACTSTDAARAGDLAVIDNGTPEGSDHWWMAYPHGSASVGGSTYPAMRVANYAAQGATLCLSSQGGAGKVGTSVRLAESNLTAYQDWAFVPDEILGRLDTPSRILLVSPSGSEGSMQLAIGGEAWSLAFDCPGTLFDARARVSTDGATYGPWRAVAGGSVENDGWGARWAPQLTFDSPSAHHVAPLPDLGSVSPSGTQALWVQVEVRKVDTAYQGVSGAIAHGPSGTATLRIAARPTPEVTAATLGPSGLVLAYSLGITSTGSSVTVGPVPGLAPATSGAGLAPSGTITVPWAKVLRIKGNGTSLSVPITCTTRYGAKASATSTVALSYSGSQGAMTISAAIGPDKAHRVTLTAPSGASVLRVWRDGGADLERVATTQWRMVAPFGTRDTAWAVATAPGEWWGVGIEMSAIPYTAMSWTWEGGGYAVIEAGSGGLPYVADSIDRAYDSYAIEGQEWPTVELHDSYDHDLSVTGVIVGGTDEDRDRFDALLRQGHATFRRESGIYSVAVTGLTVQRRDRSHLSVKVTQMREQR